MRLSANLALACLACLSGCASSVSTIEGRSQQYQFSAPLASRALANCTAENARGFSGRYTASVQELIRPDNYRVVVSYIDTVYSAHPIKPVLVARTAPAYPAQGSQLVLFVSQDLAVPEDWIARLRKGC